MLQIIALFDLAVRKLSAAAGLPCQLTILYSIHSLLNNHTMSSSDTQLHLSPDWSLLFHGFGQEGALLVKTMDEYKPAVELAYQHMVQSYVYFLKAEQWSHPGGGFSPDSFDQFRSILIHTVHEFSLADDIHLAYESGLAMGVFGTILFYQLGEEDFMRSFDDYDYNNHFSDPVSEKWETKLQKELQSTTSLIGTLDELLTLHRHDADLENSEIPEHQILPALASIHLIELAIRIEENPGGYADLAEIARQIGVTIVWWLNNHPTPISDYLPDITPEVYIGPENIANTEWQDQQA